MGGLISRLYVVCEPAIDLLLTLLDRAGSKKVLLTFSMDVLAQRWYLGYVEADEDRRLIAKLPNAYLHKDLNIHTPGSAHRHAWNSYSLILKGGYTELVDGVARTHKAGDLAVVKQTQRHEITHCEPGTVTLFMHGWRLAPWEFTVESCATLCGRCATEYGRCVNSIKTTPYELNAADGGKVRVASWMSTKTPGLERRIRIRKRALEKSRVRVWSRDEFLHKTCEERKL